MDDGKVEQLVMDAGSIVNGSKKKKLRLGTVLDTRKKVDGPKSGTRKRRVVN